MTLWNYPQISSHPGREKVEAFKAFLYTSGSSTYCHLRDKLVHVAAVTGPSGEWIVGDDILCWRYPL